MNSAGKVVLLTGASKGIGRGLALYLAERGTTLIITARRPEGLAEVSAELDAIGAPYLAEPLNAADRDGTFALIERAVATFGRIDGFLANAQSFRSVTPLEDLTEKDMDILFDTGPKGTLWGMQAVFPHMKAQGWGRIVTFGSNAALHGAAGYAPYVSSKEAIRGLTRVAAREWGKHGILVNCVCPVSAEHRAPPDDDPVRKAMFEATYKDIPLGRDGVVKDDIAPTIAFLLSEECSYMTGQTLMLDGGAIMRV
jgi:NAD(P)-dependent dehydrogenase (short-subunit alcohol dehydrogenase family)